MAKLNQLEKAIAALEAERQVLDAAITKMRQQLATKPVRRTKPRAPEATVDISEARRA